MVLAELAELHYLTPITNLPSIIRYGILSHKNAASLKGVVSIADNEVQERRKVKRVPQGRPLHEYANLYLNGRNPMMYRQTGTMGEVCVIRISTGVLHLPGVIITDRNAAADQARFWPSPTGLAQIDKTFTFAKYWTHPGDYLAERDHKARMCAEVLIPDRVETSHILGCHVNGFSALEVVNSLCDMPVKVNRNVFFG
jgi:hypothetical protein